MREDEQRRFAIIENAYKKNYDKYLRYALYICENLEDAEDAVQESFLLMFSYKGEKAIFDIDSLIFWYIKMSIYRKNKKQNTTIKHKYRYFDFYKNQQLEKTSKIEFYPLIDNVIQNVNKLSTKLKIVAKEYIMNDLTKLELSSEYNDIKFEDIKEYRKMVVRRLKNPKMIGIEGSRNKLLPSTLTIIKLRNEEKMKYKDIAKVVNLTIDQVKNRYLQNKWKNNF